MKKRILIHLILLCVSTIGWTQNYKLVDSTVLTYPTKFGSTSKLAKRISTDFSNDFEKTRAVFSWIANNVAYDPSEYGKFDFEYSSKTELEKKEKEYEKKLSKRVISKGKAVCEGYSTLFKVLCDKLNIKSKVVTGGSKTQIKDIGKRYYSDHAWNIVFIENKKYLVDVTWGAGTYENRFERKVDYFFFFTDPKLFIKNHYPDYYENALLNEKVSKKEFLNEPLIYDYTFELISPQNGIIKKSEVDKVLFRFKTDKDVNSISYDLDSKNYPVNQIKSGGTLEFEIDFTNLERQRELVFYFDYEPVIGFKLK
ncbi:transglutaminase domain-containing protein [Seonamhaeicola sp. ML3]|uniref:transglutaminase domain-containing protein n=1 Tax=Seonamhaeicola sp. ML3 TaxID=2937786 RepID=UPI00200DE60D|nr:transglutaminase domain-containing protein [Seonamhaeicola sp. ML3]